MGDGRAHHKTPAAVLGAAAAGLVLAGLVWLFSLTPWYSRLEGPALDAWFRLRPPISHTPNALTIDIDTAALDREKAWPWPRNRHTRLLQFTMALGARAVVFDIFFPEQSPPASLTRDDFFAREGHLTADDFPDYDADFANQIARADNVYLAQVFTFLEGGAVASDPQKLAAMEQWLREFVRAGKALQVDAHTAALFLEAEAPDAIPLPRFAGAARGVGAVQVREDPDGVVRHFPLFVRYDVELEAGAGRVPCLFPSLPLVVACDTLGVTLEELTFGQDRTIRIPPKDGGAPEPIVIPVNEDGMVLVNWAGDWEDTFGHVSYAQFEAIADHQRLARIKAALANEGPSLWAGGQQAVADVLAEFATTQADLRNLFQTLWGAHTYQQLLEENGALAADEAVRTVLGARAENPDLAAAQTALFRNVAAHRAALTTAPRPGGIPDALWADAVAVAEALNAVGGPTPADEPYFFHAPVRSNDLVVFAARTSPAIRDAVCFYGLTAAGTHDIAPTPVSASYPMLGTHPNLYSSIITNQLLWEMPRSWRLPIYLTLGLFVALYAAGSSAARVAFMTLLVLGAFVGGAYLLFERASWVIDVVGPVLVIANTAGAVAYQSYRREEKHRQYIRGAFEQYMNPSIVKRIADDPELLQLGGQDLDATAFFSDVAGFTTISESLTSQELVALLNEYLTAMTEIVFQYDGLLDKYEGDAIIAIFGAPVQTDDHATKACHASIDMQRKLVELRAKWKAEGRPEMTARIGVNSGNMTVGNMGSTMRFDYTMMGDTVNLASRLEGANKEYGTHVMCSEATLERCRGSVQARELDLLRVKGKNVPVRVFEIYAKAGESIDPQFEKAMAHYKRGMKLYRDRVFDDAIKEFETTLKLCPDDPPAQTYIGRCQEYRQAAPPDDWDGAYTMLTK